MGHRPRAASQAVNGRSGLVLTRKRPEEVSLSSQVKALVAGAVLALSLTAATGCGGGNNNNDNGTAATTATTSTTQTTTTPSGGGGGNLKVSADPSGALRFTKTTLSAKAGKVTITMDNPSPVQHSIGIKGNGVQQDGSPVGKGGVSTVSASLKSGTYEFFCPVDAHEQAGMKGTLTVK
jgi:plastocyanin